MRILPTPDHEQFGLDILRAGQRVIRHALAEAALVDVSGVKTNGGFDVRIPGRSAKAEMATNANPQRAELAGAGRMRLQVIQNSARIRVVAGKFLGGFERIAAVGSGRVVGEHATGGLEFVIDLRHRHDKAVSGQQRSRAANGSGNLEDFRIHQDSRIPSGRHGTKDVCPHWAVSR